MHEDNTKAARTETQHEVTPFVSVDEANERPKTVDPNAADVGGVADHFTDSSANVVENDELTGKEDGLPGDDAAIYQRGVTIIPPS